MQGFQRRKRKDCRTSYDTCNENHKKEEMWRKKLRHRERAKKTLEDLSSLRTKCEGNAKESLLLVTAEYQLLFAVDITARRARSKKKRKTIHETRETSRTIFATRHTRLARMSFSDPMKSFIRVHIVRFMLKSRKFEAFIFSLLWKERMSLLLNIITGCEIKKIASLRWKRMSRCLVHLLHRPVPY